MNNIIFAEGDTGIARMTCGCCRTSFRAYMDRVTCANGQPICSDCVTRYNPMRSAQGLPLMPFCAEAYLKD